MAELGGVVLSFAVTKLLDEVLSALGHLKNKSANFLKLQNLLERLNPSLEELTSVLRDENDPAAKWLSALCEQFEKAHDLISGSGSVKRGVLKRCYVFASRSKESVKIYKSIQALLQEASALQWASGLRIQSVLRDNDVSTHGRAAQIHERCSTPVSESSLESRSNRDVFQLVTVGVSGHEDHDQSSSSRSSLGERVLPVSDSACAYDIDVPEPPVTFVGESRANEVVHLVVNEEYKKWVALCGMGGVGKTSTASIVYADDRIKRHFSGGRYWITVTKDQADHRPQTRLRSLFTQLLQKIQGEKGSSQLPDDFQLAKSFLTNLLADARVLLVLDDVCNKDDLKYLDVVSDRFNSVILVTTRDREVLRRFQNDAVLVNIEPLSPHHSWQLFSWHAFSRRKVSREVELVARDVARECGGLPLALEVVGSTLADKELLPDEIALGVSPLTAWNKALQNLRSANCSGEYEALYSKLQFSIDSLNERDPRLLDCFLFFAAFSEHHEVSVEKLVCMWSAQGLVKDNETTVLSDEEEEAKRLLGILAARSMIKITKTGGFMKVRIHDVMRQVAQLNNKSDFASNQEIQVHAQENLYAPSLGMSTLPREWTATAICNAKRLSLQHNDFRRFPETEQVLAPQLQVLIFSENPQLRFLSTAFCKSLPNLRVLDLRRTGIKRIPGELLKRLQSLKYLDLSWCQELKEVSDEIAGSRNLEYFFLVGCSRLQRLPPVETLTNLKVYTTQQLTCTTSVKDGDNSKATDPDAPHQSRRDHDTPYRLPPNLRRLRLARKRTAPPCCSGECAFSFDVSSLAFLRELTLNHVLSLPVGITELRRLQILTMQGSYGAASFSTHALGKLPVLEEFNLKLLSVVGVPLSASEGSFLSLKKLRISCLSDTEEFFDFERGSMQRIESLEVVKHGRHFPASIVVLRSLKCVELTSFSGIEEAEDEDLKFLFRQPDCFPHLEFLKIVQVDAESGQSSSATSTSTSTSTERLQKHMLDILPGHFLQRRDSGKLKIEVRCVHYI